MFLKSVKVQHYKSLGDMTVDLSSSVTVIVGPNGVGKSNFVDVLRFLHDAVTDDLEHAVTKREGIGRLLQNYQTKPYKIGIQINFASSMPEELVVADYNLRLKAIGKSNYAVDGEGISFLNWASEDLMNDFVIYSRSSSDAIPPDSLALGSALPILSIALIANTGETTRRGSDEIAGHISNWNYCTIYPNTLKKPALPDRDTALMESGENWASVIKALKRSPKGRDALERIYDAMRAVIPTFVDVSIQTVGSYLVPLFNFRSEDEKVITGFDPVQLSDGTLRLFGILLAAYQLPRPQLLVIEEPEQTIYPGALGVLADVFKEVGQTTQVIITTHSPHLVERFKPEQIRVATMHNGLTSIRPIHPHQMEAVNEGLLSLEEFMTGEGLRPDDSLLAS
jgi:predicted ATPase